MKAPIEGSRIENAFDAYRRRLEQATENFRYDVAHREEGTVLSVADGVARVSGLANVRLDEMVQFDGGCHGLAMDLDAAEVGVVLLGADDSVQVGTSVQTTGKVAAVPVGQELLGRTVDPLGRPLDGAEPIQVKRFWPAERRAPGIIERSPVTEPLLTGLTVIDALFPIGRGQRELIIGDRGTGKSSIALDAVINQRDTGVKCVYVCVGQKASSVIHLVEQLRRTSAIAHTTVVVASAEAPPGMRFLAPYAGCTMAEFFRDRGEDALLVLDDLTKHAIAYRELALLLRRPPGREAYPGDIFFIHSRLLERATHLERDHGGGSLTALPIAETLAGRISDFIPTNLISITDGQIYLDPQLFDRGIKPAVDVGLSVSRVGGKTQRASMKAVAGELRLDTARFREVEVFTRFGSRVEEQTRKLLVRGARIRELLKQPPLRPIPQGEQVAMLLATEEGLFDELPAEDVYEMLAEFRKVMQSQFADVLKRLELGQIGGDAERDAIREAFVKSSEKRRGRPASS